MSDQLIQQISKAIIDGDKETAMATANEAIAAITGKMTSKGKGSVS